MSRDAELAFSDAVEASRMGTVFAHNAKAYNRWRQRRPAVVKRPPMSDAALEAAILRLALDNPGQVIREVRIV